MKLEKLNKLIAKGRVKAIIKDVAGRRFLFGFERLNKRSRKFHVKHFSKPIDMAELSKDAQAKAAPPLQLPPAPTPEQNSNL